MASSGNGEVEVGSTVVGDETTANLNSGASNVVNNASTTSTTTGSSKLETSSGAGGTTDTTPTNYMGVIDESVQPLKIPPSERSEDFKKLIQYGLDVKVAAKLDDIYNTGMKSKVKSLRKFYCALHSLIEF